MAAQSHQRGTVAGCLACSDPGQLPGWLKSERVRADECARQADEWRTAAAESERRFHEAVAAGADRAVVAAAQAEHRRLHGEANAVAQSALIIRAHAERVEVAHPHSARHLSQTPLDFEVTP